MSLLSFRTVSATHSPTVYEPQQRGSASQVSLAGSGGRSWTSAGLPSLRRTVINTAPFLPADTRGRSCSSGGPGMRSSPQRKYFTAHLESCRGRREAVDGQKHRLGEPLMFPQSDLTYLVRFRGPQDVMSNRGNNLLLKLLQFRSVSFQCL